MIVLSCAAACTDAHQSASSVQDLSNAQSIVRLEGDSWEVTCLDGSKETRTTADVTSQNFCKGYKTCDTAEQIVSHVTSGGAPLLPLHVSEDELHPATLASELNKKFCVHTVRDGNRNLKTGAALSYPLANGRLIAIADVSKTDALSGIARIS